MKTSYEQIVFGTDEPDVMWIPSSIGPIMLTKEGHYLCDADGNITSEVDRSYAEEWFKKVTDK